MANILQVESMMKGVNASTLHTPKQMIREKNFPNKSDLYPPTYINNWEFIRNIYRDVSL
jgi:hypothetical protein